MYSPEEIDRIVRRASKLAIEADKEILNRVWSEKIFGERYRERRLPEYYPNYRKAVDNYEEILVHADKDVFPARLFARRAPNQTDEAAKWIYDNYQNITQPIYLDFLNTILRCTHDANWSIEYGKDSDDFINAQRTFQEYVEKKIDNYGSVENFFKSIVFDVKLKDAMGVIAVKPARIPIIETDEGPVYSSTELIEPAPFYYTCKQVLSSPVEDYVLVELYEKSWVEYGGGPKKKMGRVYEFYDDQNIWIATQVGKYIDNTYRIDLYYNHGWNRIPVERLKGVPHISEGEIFYQSQFLFAVSPLNLVAQNATYMQASICKVVYPATVMLGDVCEFEENGNKCNGGVIGFYEGFGDTATYKSYTCPKCHGIGLTSRMGPLETFLLKPYIRGENEQAETQSSQKPLEYISPETTTLEFLEKTCQLRKEDARKILHLHTSNSEVKGSDDMTATGMFIDMKALYAFVMPIANQAFELLEFIYNAIGYMRYGNKFTPPQLIYPQSFDIGTAQDNLETISYMVKNNMPPVIIQAEIYRYLKSVFYTEKLSSQIYRLLIQTDRLLIMPQDDIFIEQSKGLVQDWQVILHDSAINFINDLVLENENFFDQDLTVQKEQLIAKAKLEADEARKAKQITLPGVETLIKETTLN